MAFRQPFPLSLPTLANIPAETLECDLSFATYTYSNASSVASNFSIQTMEVVPLDPGYINDENFMVFSNSDLTLEFQLAKKDVGALVDFFLSKSFSGMLFDGSLDAAPTSAAGITTAVRDPQKNLPEVFTSMATTMTDQLRSGYDASADGLSARPVVRVRVRWAWLALPSLVVLASSALLVAVAAESRRGRGVELWKASATALLMHSVSRVTGTLEPQVQGPEQLRKVVERTCVALDTQQTRRLEPKTASGSVDSRSSVSYDSLSSLGNDVEGSRRQSGSPT